MDMQSYGYDTQNVIEDFYRKSTAYVRDKKINLILKNKERLSSLFFVSLVIQVLLSLFAFEVTPSL